jgi:hypothetical protein
MIKPTPGRVVWFHPPTNKGFWPKDFTYYGGFAPLAAIVAHVWDDRMVNLSVFDSDGKPYSFTSVELLQDDDPKPEAGRFACWMPYQKGQAAKAEALEQKLAGT